MCTKLQQRHSQQIYQGHCEIRRPCSHSLQFDVRANFVQRGNTSGKSLRIVGKLVGVEPKLEVSRTDTHTHMHTHTHTQSWRFRPSVSAKNRLQVSAAVVADRFLRLALSLKSV
eukprot:3199194-Amphidinium_carterae.2